MAIPFTRSLGVRSGVQLNPVIDNTEGFVAGNGDQAFGVVGQFTRGRTDKAFRVTRSDFARKLGKPASLISDEKNEAYLHVYEAFARGAQSCVVSRLEQDDAVVTHFQISGVATTNAAVITTNASGAALGAYNSSTQPQILRFTHLENFNDGINVKCYADDNATADSEMIGVVISEVDTGKELYNFYGSLNPTATDDFGNSIYFPDVVSAQTDNFIVSVADGAVVESTSIIYGKTLKNTGADEDVILYVAGANSAYTALEYAPAITNLRYNEFDFRYIATAGEQNVGLVSELCRIAKEMNKPIVVDVPSDLDVAAAIAWVVSIGGEIQTEYAHIYWSPIEATNPVSGGKAVFGTSGMQVGYRCARNARTDANGVPPMNYPIAGKEYPITRTGMKQLINLTDDDFEELAKARINPVVWQSYAAGSSFVFTDSLTNSTRESILKLVAASEMSSQVDEWVALYAKEVLQLPMEESIRRMGIFLEAMFEAVFTAKWIKASVDLDGSAYTYTVQPNAARPFDRIDVSYGAHYDGTTRAVFIQQTISK